MKTIACRWLGLAVVVTIMMQFAPVLGSMFTSMFERYEVLADSIVQYDENGNIQVNSAGADTMLTELGDNAQAYTSVISYQAEKVFDADTEHNTKENNINLKQLSTKAKEVLNEIGVYFG